MSCGKTDFMIWQFRIFFFSGNSMCPGACMFRAVHGIIVFSNTVEFLGQYPTPHQSLFQISLNKKRIRPCANQIFFVARVLRPIYLFRNMVPSVCGINIPKTWTNIKIRHEKSCKNQRVSKRNIKV